MGASGVIFSGNDVKTLKSNIDLNGQAKVMSGTVDPTTTATSANKGSVYLNTSNGTLYLKNDNGSSTNWSAISVVSPRSTVRFSTPSGNGSTNTTVRNFTVTEESSGSDLTGSTSSTNGTSVTINTTGLYEVGWFGDSNSSGTCLIIPTNNSANLSTNPATSAYISQAQGPATGNLANCSRTLLLTAGDVVRPQTLTSAKPNATGADTQFWVVKVNG